MFDIGVQELIVILLIAVFFFGGEKLPEIARGLGKSLREFQRASEETEDDKHQERAPMERHGSTNTVVK